MLCIYIYIDMFIYAGPMIAKKKIRKEKGKVNRTFVYVICATDPYPRKARSVVSY